MTSIQPQASEIVKHTPDRELQLHLAKMLPELIEIRTWENFGSDGTVKNNSFFWKAKAGAFSVEIIPTEWLHVCWIIERTLTIDERVQLCVGLDSDQLYYQFYSSSWQDRATVLCRAKGIEL